MISRTAFSVNRANVALALRSECNGMVGVPPISMSAQRIPKNNKEPQKYIITEAHIFLRPHYSTKASTKSLDNPTGSMSTV
jgi:hypothetical protein